MKIMHLWFQPTTDRFTSLEDCKQRFLGDSPVNVECRRFMRFPIDFLSIYPQPGQAARMFQLRYSTFLNQISLASEFAGELFRLIPDKYVETSNVDIRSQRFRNNDFNRVSDCQIGNQASFRRLTSVTLNLNLAFSLLDPIFASAQS